MNDRQIVREIRATYELRALRGANFSNAWDNRQSVEIPVDEMFPVILCRHDPKAAFIMSSQVKGNLRIRVLDEDGLKSAGKFPVHPIKGIPVHMSNVFYDGAGTFWSHIPTWRTRFPSQRSSSLDDDVSDIRRFVSREIEGLAASPEDYHFQSAAQELLAKLSGKIAVVRGHSIFVGSALPEFVFSQGVKPFKLVFPEFSDLTPNASETDIDLGLFATATTLPIYESASAVQIADRTYDEASREGWYSAVMAEDFDWNADYLKASAFQHRPYSLLNLAYQLGRHKIRSQFKDEVLQDKFDQALVLANVRFGDTDKSLLVLDHLLEISDHVLEKLPDLERQTMSQEKWPMNFGPYEIMRMRAANLKKLIAEPGLAPRLR